MGSDRKKADVMLLYENGVFHMDGVSFEFPEGFYLDCGCTDGADYELKLYPPAKDYYVYIEIERTHESARKATYDWIYYDEFAKPPLPEVKLMSLNGIAGYYFTDVHPDTGTDSFMQFYADIPGLDPELQCPRVLSINLNVVNSSLKIADILSSPDFIRFCEGIKI